PTSSRGWGSAPVTSASSVPRPTARPSCWKRCSAPRCARATPSAAKRRCRAWKAWRRRSATSSICCWSGTSAAWPANSGPAAVARVSPPRTVAAPVNEVWALVSDPYSLPRWWPRTSRVENVEQRGSGRRSQWTQVLETAEGRGVRADFRCVSAAEGERYAWEQQVEGTPFAKHLHSSKLEIRLRPEDGGTEVALSSEQTLRVRSRRGPPALRC